MAVKIMVDSNVHDKVAADPVFKARIAQCQQAGSIELLTTHVQADDLANVPPNRDIGQATAINAERTSTSAAAWDVSRWDEADWGRKTVHKAFAGLASGNPKHVPDALIGVTAQTKADIFVTEDDRFRRHMQQLGVPTMSAQQLFAYLKTLPP